MEAIYNYIDTMFKNLPQTSELAKIKEELLANMEEKYHELKAEGKKDNEAIGIVISEFGNIDELLEELGINISNEEHSMPTIDKDTAIDYINIRQSASRFIAFGVFLIMFGAAFLVLLSMLTYNDTFRSSENMLSMIGVTVLIICIAIGVAIMIYADSKTSRFKFIQEGKFNLTNNAKAHVSSLSSEIVTQKTTSNIIGVLLIILSPSVLFITMIINGSDGEVGFLSVPILIIMVAAAVFIFIVGNNRHESYEQLLKTGDFTEANRKGNIVIGIIASVYWPLVVFIFLITGFLFRAWRINWIIFPVAGVVFGAISASINAYQNRKDR